MGTGNNNPLIIRVLSSPLLRALRHLLLFAFTFFVAAGIVWHVQEKGEAMSAIEKVGGLFLFLSLFWGGSYLNIYLLTPKLLLKGKWSHYFCSLSGLVLVVIFFFILIQAVYMKEFTAVETADPFAMAVNGLSSTLAVFLLFAGTTTLVLFKNWIQDMRQSEELESATLQMELKLLENQINPHFLFNMLNNANIMIRKDPDMALHIIGRLEEMLHYQINDSSREKVSLNEEIVFLNGFLELEKTRRDCFTCSITKEGATDSIQTPPLLFIVFVENAVKHSQDSQCASYIYIMFSAIKDELVFTCENSLPARAANKQAGGLGLINIRRRLDLLFKGNYSLEQTKTDSKYSVRLVLKLKNK